MVGAWHGENFDLRVVQAAGVTYMISLRDDAFGVVMIEGHDVLSLNDGRDAQHAQTAELSANHAKLGPLVLVRTGDHLAIGDGTSAAAQVVPAPELEAADLAFAADSAARGADAWVAVTAQGGALWRRNERVEGEAMRAPVAALLAKGKLTWQPIASGSRGDLGFTVGTYKFNDATGSYVTIWKREGGGWKMLFDLGS